jgi:diguanylate cyclase (GGDEF)-like protein
MHDDSLVTSHNKADLFSLVKFAILLNSEKDLDSLLELITQEANRLVIADRTTLYLIDEENKEVYSKVALGLEGREIRLPLGRGIAGITALSGETSNISNVQTDLRHAGHQFDYITRSMLTVPLRLNTGQIIGVIQALNKNTGSFDKQDEKLLGLLCELAVVAIERVSKDELQKKLSEELNYQARHDALTGLPNRLLLEESLETTLSEAERKRQQLAVLFVDLDRFKLINDSMGHRFGDLLLQQVAHRLKSALRYGDLVARQGGDEFVIVLRSVRNEQSVHRFVQTLLKSLQQPFYLEGQEIYISASIGISLYPLHGKSVTELLRSADTAMYKIKDQGKNGYQFFEPEMSETEKRRLWLVTELHKAVEYGELMLFYQPQLHLASGQLSGVEALIRWKHPEKGLISPGEFIPLAEETGLIVRVGTWVLHEACRQAKEWQSQGLPPLRIGVNVSALQFRREDFVELVIEALQRSKLEPCYLELELTEGLLLGDTQGTISKLKQLKELGVTIAIDDFGTGYSSLSYLQRLPIDTLKIDQSFVRRYGVGDEEDEKYEALLKAISMLGHNLKMKVIAEGVETEYQKAYLEQIGCEEVQGYLFSRPLNATDLEKFMLAQHKEDETQKSLRLIA